MRNRPWHSFWGFIVLLMISVAIFAPVISPYNPYVVDVRNLRSAPDGEHWAGTDNLGRDLTSRLIYGARTSLFVAACAVIFGTVVGGAWGIASGYLGGYTDLIGERLIEILLALPG